METVIDQVDDLEANASQPTQQVMILLIGLRKQQPLIYELPFFNHAGQNR
jgi:hypothetical protein